MTLSHPQRVAIIGGGCTGVTCFWALQNFEHDVHLFEASASLGGRIKTLPVEHNGIVTDVDTESPPFNAEASPNLMSLLRCLGMNTSAVPFGFGVSKCDDTYEWCESVLRTLILKPELLCNLETCRTLLEILWFKYLVMGPLKGESRRWGSNDIHESLSTHEYFSNEGHSEGLCDKYLAPLVSALWGTNAGRVLPEFPVKALINSLSQHKLLSTRRNLVDFRRISDGTTQLIQSMTSNFPPSQVHLETRVRSISHRGKKQYGLVTADGREMSFDHVVFAIDSDEILKLLGCSIDSEEKKTIQNLRTTKNIAVLHSDPLLTSGTDRPWPAINYIIAPSPHPKHTTGAILSRKSSLTYNVNPLQDIPPCLFDRLYITLNPFIPPHPRYAHDIWEFTDPELSTTTLRAQSHLPSIQNTRGLSYGFRWTGRGFLEDAVTSGLQIAVEQLGARVPFEVVQHADPLESGILEESDLRLREHVLRTVLCLVRVFVLVFEIFWIVFGSYIGWFGRKGKA
ncbi:FAD/NAD(P)-binding domain-containing protein [Aspergillus avenaceus]|uniref:FAD/NAD(P)-binding domain-containing protein n=1 Tax=Aspergillus avenaceus TaxID=36643 RepID=A0A5N6TEY4_ASPAV|nr:FAD/NAD(P)-binding domain-containing protein [Aspergillus avenaceus]